MQVIWFPSADTKESRIVGRFIDHEHTYADKDGKHHTRVVTMLEHKVPGSSDISASLVKPFNKAELTARFPQAWKHYEDTKAKEANDPPPMPTAIEHGIKGEPIENLNFLGKDKLAYLKSMGFLVAEQIATMSDAQCQSIGFGAKAWRKKAADHLTVKATQS